MVTWVKAIAHRRHHQWTCARGRWRHRRDRRHRGAPDNDDALTIAFEVSTRDRANCWMRVRGTITNRWSGERRDIDDEISLATVRHPGGGRRWCFVCPSLGQPVRALYLPGGARHFRSRQAYDLAYETEHLDDRERAWRRVRKCRRQLGSDPDGIGQPYPEKPAGMLPSRYAYLLDRLHAAEDDLDLPLTLGGPRFAYRPDRQRLRGRS
jgi:hypothetical protein